MHLLNSKITRHKLQIKNIRQEAPHTFSYDLEKPENETWDEGTYVHVSVMPFNPEEASAHKTYVRHFSIASLPEEDFLTLTTRVMDQKSVFKESLAKLKVGDYLEVFKFANHMKLRRVSRPTVIISSGVGVATARPMVKAFINDPSLIDHLVHLHVDSTSPFIYNSDFELWKSLNERFIHVPVTGRKSFFEELDIVARQQNAIFYLIGSDEFIMDVRGKLTQYGIDERHIFLDKKQSFYDLHHFPIPTV